jgi:hypothetical protein
MPISRQDSDEILRFVRELVRSSPMALVDEQVIGAAFDGDPERQLPRYLDALVQAIAARGGYGLPGTLRTLNDHVRTESGQRISGIEVAFDDERARTFDTHAFVLQSDSPIRELAEALTGIRSMIERELPPRRGDQR